MNTKLNHQIYMDLFQSSAQRIGMSLFHITDKLSTRFEKWCDKLDRDILPKNRINPEPHLLVPILEGMVYHTDDTPIQEMFYNLLKNAMDKTKQDLCHPSFPLILKQLSVDDIYFLLNVQEGKISYNMEIYENYQVKNILINNGIKRIYDDTYDIYSMDSQGQLIRQSLIICNIIEQPNTNNIQYPMITKYAMQISNHGKQFLQACMSERTEELINNIINKNKED